LPLKKNQNSPRYKLIILCGPTGVGKTDFAIHLARQFNGEIVGADAMQIYRRMDIGTAKPTSAEQAAVPHHMIDIVNPDQDFDAASYARMADGIIPGIVSRGRNVFVVGGTGFYIKALVYGLFKEGPSDPAVRRRLKQQAESEGAAVLHRRLSAVDSVAAERIHPNDTYRIIRALEVFEVTGEPLTVFQQRHGFREQRYTTLQIGLFRPRPVLYDRINQRVDLMMAHGFIEEVRQLLGCGYGSDLKSMQSLGYRHLAAVIHGDTSLVEAVTTLKRDHRRYAKRQMTWFNADREVVWVDPVVSKDVENRTRKFLSDQ
jgi:tRNA dimethylallyltransferase